MKHINIIANNITIEPYGIYKINVNYERNKRTLRAYVR